jgi:hypothetical protein
VEVRFRKQKRILKIVFISFADPALQGSETFHRIQIRIRNLRFWIRIRIQNLHFTLTKSSKKEIDNYDIKKHTFLDPKLGGKWEPDPDPKKMLRILNTGSAVDPDPQRSKTFWTIRIRIQNSKLWILIRLQIRNGNKSYHKSSKLLAI